MSEILRRILVVLIAFAIVGAATARLEQATAAGNQPTMAGMPCMMAASMQADDGHAKPMAPCRMTADCMKQMGCSADALAPVRTTAGQAIFHTHAVVYWQGGALPAGIAREPDPIPPRTA